MPHRFPYSSLLLFSFLFSSFFFFFLRYARTVIVDLTDRSLLLRRVSAKPTVYPSREEASSSEASVAVILRATTVREAWSTLAILLEESAIRTPNRYILAPRCSTKMYFSREVVRRIKETAMAVA